MAIEQIKMPQLGESVTEGTISKWLVSPGDIVKKYDPLAEVMTDKVNAEIPSSFSGTIKKIVANEGDTLSVGEVILLIDAENNDALKSDKPKPIETKAKTETNIAANDSSNNSRKRYSPAVLKLSQEYEIDLLAVNGTGAGGRITRKDLLKIIESKSIPQSQSPVKPMKQEKKLTESISYAQHHSSNSGDKEIPVTGVRKAIAANMVHSKTEIPHAWTMVEVDVTNLVAYRNSIKEEFKRNEGFNLTYFAFFVKAVAQVLKEFPQINSMWAEDRVIQKKEINLSIAVATEDALFVPVIKRADEKTIKGIAREIAELASKARNGKLRAEDSKDGTFTVNNTGAFGSVQSMGIINHPQAAILQVESIVKRPVVFNNGMIAVRDIVNLCLSLDHRVLDGLICGRFLQRLKEVLESISKENTPIY